MSGNDEDAIQTEQLEQSISFYPNPASQQVVIELSSSTVARHVISLIDMTGRRVKSTIKNSEIGLNQYTIDTDDLKDGIYLLSLETTEGVVLKREKLMVIH